MKLFVGGIPPFLLFEMEYRSLFALVEHHKTDLLFKKANPATEAGLISLVAHFEALCKHQFASLINIHPKILKTFSERRGQASIKLSDLVSLWGQLEESMGFVVAEQYDFGSAELINGLFRDLLSVTPFSKDESEKYNSILMKRHLLVHHAGFYTLQYLKGNSVPEKIRDLAFKDSVLVSTEDYHEMSDFLFDMAMKITRVTVGALKRELDIGGSNEGFTIEAFKQLLAGLYDSLE